MIPTKRETKSDLIRHALSAVGKVLYVWGGGWNEADDGAGSIAMIRGIPPSVTDFTCEMTRNCAIPCAYDYREHRYRLDSGYDCSGYLGWVIWQVLGPSPSPEGYVFPSAKQARMLAHLGLGQILPDDRKIFAGPGDIVSIPGHVYLSLGCEEDGSMLIVHASPPAVSLSAVPAPGAEENGVAVLLARTLCRSVWPLHAARFPVSVKSRARYTQKAEVFRFDPHILPDPDGISELSAAEVMRRLITPSFIKQIKSNTEDS